MRFFVDRCAGRRLAEAPLAAGHDVIEARTLGPDPGDTVLLESAAAEDRILITIDTDFGKLAFVDRARHTGMLRLPDVPAARRIVLAMDAIQRHESDLAAARS